MDHQTFKNLDEAHQFLSLWKHGAFIDERTDNTYRYRLYQLGAFYVEEKWELATNIRHSQHIFTSTEYLDIYLDKIDILVGHQPIG
ncbi:MAG TPA: hypothetical protein PKM63_12415 [Panacibacter sp.]|nr:hypothetical protein [Panacibacter sp.]HNP45084.1 hypothetical protein [Panacibacter sp.]